MYRLANAPVRPFPFPHFFVEDVFPADLFARIRNHLPSIDSYRAIGETGRVSQGAYPERFTLEFFPEDFQRVNEKDRPVWTELANWLLGPAFRFSVLSKFQTLLRQRFGDSLDTINFQSSATLIRDFTNYRLAPHSDHPSKVVVILFYLPESPDTEHLGTSYYLPHDAKIQDDSGGRLAREHFALAARMPFRPNCATGFFRTPRSFHGVERVDDESVQRDLIQFAITYSGPAK
jgi:hypothetical protein